ncbi:MAG: immunoglobulin-like domain-containing protein [Candidatus Hydrogenedentota bacterium]
MIPVPKNVLTICLFASLCTLAMNAYAANINIQSFSASFSPSDVVINVGDSVTWTNLQPAHNVVETNGPADESWNGVGFRSGPVGAVSTYMFTFTSPGLYYFVCEPHAFIGMKGTVTVQGNVDSVPPVITLTGSPSITLAVGGTYIDAGATATDDVDGNLTSSIAVTGLPSNPVAAGDYTVRYNVSDTAGNPAIEVTRAVHVAKLNEIYVQFEHGNSGEEGSLASPFDTVGEGIAAVTGSGTIWLLTGQTSDKPTITTAMFLKAYSGIVSIGVGGMADERKSTSYTYTSNSSTLDSHYTSVDSGTAKPTSGFHGFHAPAPMDAIFEEVMPYEMIENGVRPLRADQTIAIRLRATDAIDWKDIWVKLPDALVSSVVVTWFELNAAKTDGWVFVSSPNLWPDGEEIITVAAGNENFRTAEYQFMVSPSRAGVSETETLTYETSDIQQLQEGIREPLRIHPQQVFENTKTVWLEIPDGTPSDAIRLMYFKLNGTQDGEWHSAENVAGFLESTAPEVVRWEGLSFIGYRVRHGGIVQLRLNHVEEK